MIGVVIGLVLGVVFALMRPRSRRAPPTIHTETPWPAGCPCCGRPPYGNRPRLVTSRIVRTRCWYCATTYTALAASVTAGIQAPPTEED